MHPLPMRVPYMKREVIRNAQCRDQHEDCVAAYGTLTRNTRVCNVQGARSGPGHVRQLGHAEVVLNEPTGHYWDSDKPENFAAEGPSPGAYLFSNGTTGPVSKQDPHIETQVRAQTSTGGSQPRRPRPGYLHAGSPRQPRHRPWRRLRRRRHRGLPAGRPLRHLRRPIRI